jgi:hypothetical protein
LLHFHKLTKSAQVLEKKSVNAEEGAEKRKAAETLPLASNT